MSPIVAIALRYVRPRRISAIGIIGIISVVGIALGTAALIIVLSLFNGFRGVAIDSMTSSGPHVRVLGHPPVDARELGGVQLVQPVYQSTLVVQLPGRTTAVRALGVRSELVQQDVARATIIGTASIERRGASTGAVISLDIAEALNVYLGDTLVIIAPEAIESSLLSMSIPTGVRVDVRGILAPPADASSGAPQMYLLDSVVTTIARASMTAYTFVRLDDPSRAEDVAATMRARGMQVETWTEMHRSMFDMMRLERIGSFIVLSLIVLVAAFNILVSLTLGVMDKRRDIAILKAVGATDRQVHRIFQLQGLILGVGSVLVGSILGVGLCIGQQTFAWIRFDVSKGYVIPSLPVDVHVVDVAAVAIMGIILGSVAALYPARRAAHVIVADAVRR